VKSNGGQFRITKKRHNDQVSLVLPTRGKEKEGEEKIGKVNLSSERGEKRRDRRSKARKVPLETRTVTDFTRGVGKRKKQKKKTLNIHCAVKNRVSTISRIHLSERQKGGGGVGGTALLPRQKGDFSGRGQVPRSRCVRSTWIKE